MSRVHDCRDPQDRQAGLAAAAAAARRGELVVVPTESVYAVATDAFSPAGVAALLAAKGRSRGAGVPVLVASPGVLDAIAEQVGPAGRALVDAFWPGPLTVLVAARTSLVWDVGADHAVVAVRMPDQPVLLDLLRAVGPMTVTAANIAGLPQPRTVAEARLQLGAAASVYLDSGPLPEAPVSTVVDLTGPVPRLRRAGPLDADQLRAVAPGLDVSGVPGPSPDAADPPHDPPSSPPPAAPPAPTPGATPTAPAPDRPPTA